MTLPIRAKLTLAAISAALVCAGVATAPIVNAKTAQPVENAPAAKPTRKYVRAGRMLDTRTGKMLTNVYIGVVDGKIESVSSQAPAGDVEIIDLSNKFVLPGLIDAHVHLLVPWPDYSPMAYLRAGTGERTLWGVRNAGIYLDQGFTTVRDACTFDGPGGASYAQFALRDAVARGDIRGPRIIAAGQCISKSGGHGDGLVLPPEFGLGHATNVADTADEIEQVVNRDIKYGAEWIKVMATGGVLDPVSDYTIQELSDAQLVRAVDTAHRAGRKVMAHAEGTKGIIAAVRAGVDSVEHGTMLDETGAKLMAQHGTWLIPTLVCFQRSDLSTSSTMPEAAIRKTRAILSYQQGAFTLAIRKGVQIVFGDDDIAGLAHEEFGALVRGGLTSFQAIQTSTINAAKMLDIPAGVIETGRVADLVAFDNDPTKDITALYRPVFVMKNGKVDKALVR